MKWFLLFAGVGCLLVLAVLLAISTISVARDARGRYAGSDLKSWFDGLRSGNGPCCSDADGYALSDVDWETRAGRYRVRIPRWRFEPSAAAPAPPDGTEMVWIEVDDESVITEPNRAGRTMVWPIWGHQGPSIRCFMPGSMT
ncbi:hypothetical protein ACIPUD_10650 [Bradyrhizobium sp. CAR08]